MKPAPPSPSAGRAWPESALRFLLRYVGTVSLLALVAVFMPQSWMDVTHRALGMGPLPEEPIVGYLARSLSLFYALQGGLLWLLSVDPRRHRSVLRYLGIAFILFGVVIWGVDISVGMPGFWKYSEGAIVIAFGSLIYTLTGRLKDLSINAP